MMIGVNPGGVVQVIVIMRSLEGAGTSICISFKNHLIPIKRGYYLRPKQKGIQETVELHAMQFLYTIQVIIVSVPIIGILCAAQLFHLRKDVVLLV